MTITFKVDNLKNMRSMLKAFAETLKAEGVAEDDIFAGKLVSCELITNVIRHGRDEAEFSGTLTGEEIIITVTADSFKGVNLNRPVPDVFAESGRGLYIVKSLCRGEIECSDRGDIKVVIPRRK